MNNNTYSEDDMGALAGVGMFVWVIAVAFGVYLLVMMMLLPHYVRQIRNELRLISRLLGGGAVAAQSFDGLTPEQIVSGDGDRFRKIRALADLRDSGRITADQFEDYRAKL